MKMKQINSLLTTMCVKVVWQQRERSVVEAWKLSSRNYILSSINGFLIATIVWCDRRKTKKSGKEYFFCHITHHIIRLYDV